MSYYSPPPELFPPMPNAFSAPLPPLNAPIRTAYGAEIGRVVDGRILDGCGFDTGARQGDNGFYTRAGHRMKLRFDPSTGDVR